MDETFAGKNRVELDLDIQKVNRVVAMEFHSIREHDLRALPSGFKLPPFQVRVSRMQCQPYSMLPWLSAAGAWPVGSATERHQIDRLPWLGFKQPFEAPGRHPCVLLLLLGMSGSCARVLRVHLVSCYRGSRYELRLVDIHRDRDAR